MLFREILDPTANSIDILIFLVPLLGLFCPDVTMDATYMEKRGRGCL